MRPRARPLPKKKERLVIDDNCVLGESFCRTLKRNKQLKILYVRQTLGLEPSEVENDRMTVLNALKEQEQIFEINFTRVGLTPFLIEVLRSISLKKVHFNTVSVKNSLFKDLLEYFNTTPEPLEDLVINASNNSVFKTLLSICIKRGLNHLNLTSRWLTLNFLREGTLTVLTLTPARNTAQQFMCNVNSIKLRLKELNINLDTGTGMSVNRYFDSYHTRYYYSSLKYKNKSDKKINNIWILEWPDHIEQINVTFRTNQKSFKAIDNFCYWNTETIDWTRDIYAAPVPNEFDKHESYFRHYQTNTYV